MNTISGSEKLDILPSYEPELVRTLADPIGNGFFVVDRTILGRSWGGVRVAPDMTLEEIRVLARTMTVKNLLAGIPIGGAKVGVRSSGAAHERDRLIEIVSQLVGPSIKSRTYFPGTDIGFTEDDANEVYARAHSRHRLFSGSIRVGEACAEGILTCLEYVEGMTHDKLGDRTVALEGFGRIGAPTAKLLFSRGFRIIAVSNLAGTLFDVHGLNIDDLDNNSRSSPEEFISTYVRAHGSATRLERDAINTLESSVLIPGARTLTIDATVAEKVKAKVICPISNAPITGPAERLLALRGVLSIPDVISNSGGMVASFAQHLGADEAQTRAIISERITQNLESVLTDPESGEPPKVRACRIASERLEELNRFGKMSVMMSLSPWIRAIGLRAVVHGLKEYFSITVTP